jgi:putative transcription factor
MDHQDWEPVVFKKRIDNRNKKVTDVERVANGVEAIHAAKIGGSKNNQIVNTSSKIQKEALDNDGMPKKIETIDRKISLNIQRARQTEGLTQKQLAQQVNQPVTMIQDYECGKAIPNANLINKLEKVLKTKLR